MNDSVNRRRGSDSSMDEIKQMLKDQAEGISKQIGEVKTDIKEGMAEMKVDMHRRMDRIENTLNQTQIKQGELDGRVTNAAKQIGDLWRDKMSVDGSKSSPPPDDSTVAKVVDKNFKYIAGLIAMALLGFFGFDFDDAIHDWVTKQ